MILYGNGGLLFELTIGGYQFPEIQNDHWDLNWLFVRGKVEHSRDSWNFREACLTTFDLQRLAYWFENIGCSDVIDDFIGFMEPNLAFSYNADREPIIIVRLSHECAPPWLDFDVKLEGACCEFPMASNNLKQVAQSLKTYLEQFPKRS